MGPGGRHSVTRLRVHVSVVRSLDLRGFWCSNLTAVCAVRRYRRCGKGGCHCAEKGAAGHGPSWSLTREVGGKTVTRVIPAGAVAETREQIAEHRRFRALVRELVETSEQLCDAKLEAGEASSDEAAKKGASKKPSTRKSRPRSKRS